MVKSFTIGERRGMIALLIVLVITITTIYFANNHSCSIVPTSIDSSAIIKRQAIIGDTINVIKPQLKKQKQNKRYKKVPTRNPLSQPLPYDIK